MRRCGFTLLEVTLVLLILSVVGAAVALRMRAPMRGAQARDVLGRLATFDSRTRAYARRHDRSVRLVVEFARGEIRRTDPLGTEDLGEPLRLPSWCRLRRLRLGEKSPEAGSIGILCTNEGLTPSYALELELTERRSVWLLVCGLTGEAVTFDDDEALDTVWQAFNQGRHAG